LFETHAAFSPTGEVSITFAHFAVFSSDKAGIGACFKLNAGCRMPSAKPSATVFR
jgi:hypothetical protein